MLAFAVSLGVLPAHATHELIFLSGVEDCAIAFADSDGDGWGNETRATDHCNRPASYVGVGDDCNDGDPAVHPGVDDVPDASYADLDCDGIDGEIDRAAFVAPDGADGPACSIDAPCSTITHALARAVADATRDHVYVRAGQYQEQLALVAGESVFGGYNANWVRAGRGVAGHAVTIERGVRATGITAAPGSGPMLENLIVLGSPAVGTGASSVGVQIAGSIGIVLARVQVLGSAGGEGISRIAPPARPTEGIGGKGNPGCEDSTLLCAKCERPLGGDPGASSCDRFGGVGGLPGHSGGGGSSGGPGAGGTLGGSGATCGGSQACDGVAGETGQAGTAGSAGIGGAAIGTFGPAGYAGASGAFGTAGTDGNGGGGGGGGGGGDQDCDSYGSAGGGGGGGGCGGLPGFGGGGGGGSFGVLLFDASVSIIDSVIGAGTGGDGGNGASGGAGGIGGGPGPGGDYGGSSEQDDGGDGAAGGRGGNGGRGGDGGGGGGGPAIGIACAGASTLVITGSQVNGGVAGTGGSGGAPAGAPGTAGLAQPTFGCP